MPYFKVIMRVDIERVVEAENEEEALELADPSDMMYELKNFGVDEEFIVNELD